MQAYKRGMDAAPGVFVKEYYEAQKGKKTEEDKYAEIRLGTHPNGPATLQQHGSQTLIEYISETSALLPPPPTCHLSSKCCSSPMSSPSSPTLTPPLQPGTRPELGHNKTPCTSRRWP
mmetsp:Transcript_19332/g.39991  ORF Transcript_19332/g.39991 Transcript_19332/m.39991 type:complete len:118 (+) Transcript_19332:1231-1584(+)